VIGSPDARSLVDDAAKDQYVVAWNVKDGDKFKELIKREGDSRESGEVGGETAYESQDGSVVIVKGDTLVGANDRPTLEAALEQKDADGGLTEEQFDGALEGLPEDALVRVYGNAQKLLEADPATATARRVKWVGGLRTFGLTGTAEGDGLAIDVRIATEGVSEADLPIAPGDAAPRVAREGVYSYAIRDWGYTIRSTREIFNAADPEGAASIDALEASLERDLKIDFERDVIDQLYGNTTSASDDGRSWAIQSEVKDPAAMEKTVAKIAAAGETEAFDFAEDDGLVRATEENGDRFYFGMVDGVFVAAGDPDRAKAMARVEPEPVDGAKGSQVLVADGEAIAKSILERQGGAGALGGQFFTGAVGDLIAWVSAKPDVTRARIKLTVK
jgi:hypothetical protein